MNKESKPPKSSIHPIFSNDAVLSALMDGDKRFSKPFLSIVEISNNPALLQKWLIYHLISSTLKGDLPAQMQFDLVERIAQAIKPIKIKKPVKEIVKTQEKTAISATQPVEGIESHWKSI